MIVDGHVHVFRPAAVSPREVSELAPAERDAPVEELLGMMDEAGVDAAVLVPLDTNDAYVAGALAEHPRRFAAIAVAGPSGQGLREGVDPLAALERRRETFPFHGLRTGWLGDPSRPLAESPMLAVLRWLAAHDLVLWTYLTPDQLPLLLELPKTMPELTIVLNHLGFFPSGMRVDRHGRPSFRDALPWERVDAVLALAPQARVNVMISGQYALSQAPYPHRDLDGLIQRIVGEFGAGRCLWASDLPWTREVPGYRETLALVESALPEATAAQLDAIRGGTAQRLFPHLKENDDT